MRLWPHYFPTPCQLYRWGFLISLLIDPFWFGQCWVHQPYGPHMVPTEKVRVFFGFVCTFYLWDDVSWCEKVLKPACVIFADVMCPIWLEGIHCLSVEQERTSGIVDGCPVHKLGVEVDIITRPELCTMYTLIDFLFNHQILRNRVVFQAYSSALGRHQSDRGAPCNPRIGSTTNLHWLSWLFNQYSLTS